MNHLNQLTSVCYTMRLRMGDKIRSSLTQSEALNMFLDRIAFMHS